jgi:hypothetical protein
VQTQLAEAREEKPVTRARASVSMHQDAVGANGRFELTRDDGTRYVRELGGASCDEAAQALAFVLAYALGGGDPEHAPLPEIPAQPAPAPPVDTPAPTPAATAPTRAPVAVAKRSTWQLGAFVQLGARSGLGPIWTPVESGLLELRRSRAGVLAPVLRVAAVRAEPITRIDRAGSTDFSWLAARVEACPLQLSLAEPLTLLPCLGVHLGQIVAVGAPRDAAGAAGRRAEQLWADAAGAIRLELSVLRVLQIEAQTEVVVPFTPYRFAFDNPDTSVYQVPDWAFAGFVGLGVHFP